MALGEHLAGQHPSQALSHLSLLLLSHPPGLFVLLGSGTLILDERLKMAILQNKYLTCIVTHDMTAVYILARMSVFIHSHPSEKNDYTFSFFVRMK